MSRNPSRIVKPLAAAALLLASPAATAAAPDAYFDLGVGSYGANYRSPEGIPLDIARHDWAYICFGNEDGPSLVTNLNTYLSINPRFKMVVRLWPNAKYVRKCDGPKGQRRDVLFLDYLYYPEAKEALMKRAFTQLHLVLDNVTKPENVYGLTVFEELPAHFCFGFGRSARDMISKADPGLPVDDYLADFAQFYERETGRKMTEWNRDVRVWWGQKFAAAMADIYRELRADSPRLKIFAYLMTQYRPLDWLRPGEDIHSPQVIPCRWSDLVKPGELADGFFAYCNNAVWTKRYHDLATKNGWLFFSQLSHTASMRLGSWKECLGYAHAKIPENLGYFSYEWDFEYGHWNDDPDVLPEDRASIAGFCNRRRRALALRNVGMDIVRRELVPEVVLAHSLGKTGIGGHAFIDAVVINRRTDKWLPAPGEAHLRNVKVRLTVPEGFVLPPEVSPPGEMTVDDIEPSGVKRFRWWARRTGEMGAEIPVKLEVAAEGVTPVVVESREAFCHPVPASEFKVRGKGDAIRYINYALPKWRNPQVVKIECLHMLVNPSLTHVGRGRMVRYRGRLAKGDRLVISCGSKNKLGAVLERKGAAPVDVTDALEGESIAFDLGLNDLVFDDDYIDTGFVRGKVAFEPLAEE